MFTFSSLRVTNQGYGGCVNLFPYSCSPRLALPRLASPWFSLFAFTFSLFAFRFALFAVRFSLFDIRFSLFAFRFSLLAFRFSFRSFFLMVTYSYAIITHNIINNIYVHISNFRCGRARWYVPIYIIYTYLHIYLTLGTQTILPLNFCNWIVCFICIHSIISICIYAWTFTIRFSIITTQHYIYLLLPVVSFSCSIVRTTTIAVPTTAPATAA